MSAPQVMPPAETAVLVPDGAPLAPGGQDVWATSTIRPDIPIIHVNRQK